MKSLMMLPASNVPIDAAASSRAPGASVAGSGVDSVDGAGDGVASVGSVSAGVGVEVSVALGSGTTVSVGVGAGVGVGVEVPGVGASDAVGDGELISSALAGSVANDTPVRSRTALTPTAVDCMRRRLENMGRYYPAVAAQHGRQATVFHKG